MFRHVSPHGRPLRPRQSLGILVFPLQPGRHGGEAFGDLPDGLGRRNVFGKSIIVAVVFGLGASTVFTLFVVPLVYWLIYGRRPAAPVRTDD
jgi:hypothetical protein